MLLPPLEYLRDDQRYRISLSQDMFTEDRLASAKGRVSWDVAEGVEDLSTYILSNNVHPGQARLAQMLV